MTVGLLPPGSLDHLSTVPGLQVTREVDLAPLTSVRVGGRCAALVEVANEDALVALQRWLTESGVPRQSVLILGRGTNVLLNDERPPELAVRLTGELARIQGQGGRVEVGGGTPVGALLREAMRHGWGGLEFLTGTPGTLGGSVVMNAGTREGEVWDRILEVWGVDGQGHVVTLDRDQARPRYRAVTLPPGWVVSRVVLAVVPTSPKEVERRIRDLMAQRRAVQPIHEPSFGSTFKNPPGAPGHMTAGQLIEAVGLKGRRVGGAESSPRHANFLINRGGARAEDFLALMRVIRAEVERVYGIRLELEVRLVGFTPEELEGLV